MCVANNTYYNSVYLTECRISQCTQNISNAIDGCIEYSLHYRIQKNLCMKQENICLESADIIYLVQILFCGMSTKMQLFRLCTVFYIMRYGGFKIFLDLHERRQEETLFQYFDSYI